MARLNKISIRKFINTKGYHSMASIGVFVGTDTEYTINGSIEVTDCHRKVILDIDVYDEEDVEQVLYKFDTMIDVLTKGRKQVKKLIKKQLPVIIKAREEREQAKSNNS